MEENNYIRSVVIASHTADHPSIDNVAVRLNKALLANDEKTFNYIWSKLSQDTKIDLFLWSGTFHYMKSLNSRIADLLNHEIA